MIVMDTDLFLVSFRLSSKMTRRLYLCFVAFFGVIGCISGEENLGLSDTTPEIFPFHALIRGVKICNGILLSENYILAPASCIYKAVKLTVFLGFNGYPYYVSSHAEPYGQIQYTDQYIIHEDYSKQSDTRYLNNIAVVKLPKSVKLSKTIQPGKLITKDMAQHLEGKTVEISGWKLSTQSNLKVAQVKIRSQDKCKWLFGENFFENQEICVHWFHPLHLNILGNAVSSNGRVIGFQTTTPLCTVDDPTCSRNDMILNVAPFLDWIVKNTQINLSETTEPTKPNDIEDKFEKLHDIIKGVKKQQQTDVAEISKKLDEVLKTLQITRTQNGNFAAKLDEETNDRRTEIENSERKQNATIIKLQEDLDGTRTEITNGLAAQKAEFDNLARRIDTLSTRRPEDEDMLKKIENSLVEINQQTAINKLSIQELSEKFTRLDDTFWFALKNITDITSHRLDQFNNDIQYVKNELQEKTRVIRELSQKNDKEQEKLVHHINLIEVTVDEKKSYFEKKITHQEEVIATIQKSLTHLEKTVKSCCGNRDFTDYQEPPPY